MSLRTIPPFFAGVLCGCGRVFRVAALGPAAGACRCTFRKRHQGTLSGALRSEARRDRSAREGGFPCRSVGRCAPAASLGKGRGTRTVTSASSAQHEEICGAPPLLSEGEERGGAPRQPRWRLCGVCSAWIRSSYSGAVGKKTVFWLSRKSTTPRKVIVLPGGWSVATLPTSALNPAVGVTCSEAS